MSKETQEQEGITIIPGAINKEQKKLLERQIMYGPPPKVDIFADVLEFRKQYKLASSKFPVNPPSFDKRKSVDLIREESSELHGATSIEENLDACIDLLYVVVQKFYDLGLSEYWEEGWRRVHRANMNKLWTREQFDALEDKTDYQIYESNHADLYIVTRFNKIQKPPTFKSPNHTDLFEL